MDANTENNFLAPPSVTSSPVCSSPSTCPTRATSTSRPWCTGSSPTTTRSPVRSVRSGRSRRDLQLPTATPVQADLGGRNQLLHGSRLPAGEHAVLLDQRPRRLVRTEGRLERPSLRFRAVAVVSTASKTEFNSEPIRLTFDASKAVMGSEVLALRRRLGRLSLLAEQVRPRPQCDARRLHARGNRPEHQHLHRVLVYSGVTVKF
jgi:hypothetical protein